MLVAVAPSCLTSGNSGQGPAPGQPGKVAPGVHFQEVKQVRGPSLGLQFLSCLKLPGVCLGVCSAWVRLPAQENYVLSLSISSRKDDGAAAKVH